MMTRTSRTVPSPTARFADRAISRARNWTWTAHAGAPAATTRTPDRRLRGAVRAASSGPTTASHPRTSRPRATPPRRGAWSRTSRSTARSPLPPGGSDPDGTSASTGRFLSPRGDTAPLDLPRRGEPPSGHLPHRQVDIVAVGTDQRGPPDDLLVSSFAEAAGHGRLQVLPRLGIERRPVLDPKALAGHGLELVSGPRTDPAEDLPPSPAHRGAVSTQLAIPGLEVRWSVRSLVLLEQSVALAEGPVVGRPGGLLGRPQRVHGLIREPASVLGLTLDDVQVLRDDHHRPDPLAEIALPPDAAPVDLDPVRSGRPDLHLNQHPTPSRGHLAPEIGPVHPRSDQGLVCGHPRRPQREEVVSGLQEVGLSLGVRADGDHEAARDLQGGLAMVPEVTNLEPDQPHPAGLPHRGRKPDGHHQVRVGILPFAPNQGGLQAVPQ